MRRWYLIHTKPLAEPAAKANLARQGYESYLPRLVEIVRRQNAYREQAGPLFPRYLFLRLDEGVQSLAPVRSTIGVATVVRFGSNYAVVPDRIIADLRAREDRISGLHTLTRSPSLERGTPVRIAEGPFGGIAGIFERTQGRERVTILLRLLGHEVRAELPSVDVLHEARAA